MSSSNGNLTWPVSYMHSDHRSASLSRLHAKLISMYAVICNANARKINSTQNVASVKCAHDAFTPTVGLRL